MTEPIYFDNAATSHPKPESVYRAVDHFMREVGASPGRSAHRMSISAGQVVLDARERLAELFGVSDPSRIILTANCTEALNLAIKGWLRPGDHVVTSSVEHNSVMRPLRSLEAAGTVEVTVVACTREGWLDPEQVPKHLKANTRLIVLTHASNVVGTVQPVAEVGRLARERGILFLVDAAQSAGVEPINLDAQCVDLLAFSGHKGLLGPQGTGGLALREDVPLVPLKQGGTGSRSQHEVQPDHLPDRYESGTLNGPGIAGLAAGVAYVQEVGVSAINKKLKELTALVLAELDKTPGVAIYGPRDPERQTAVISFTLAGVDTGELEAILDERFGIMTRSGLHCSPAAHKTIGTFRHAKGTLRASLGPFNTAEQVAHFGRCLRELAREHGDHRGG
jgi:cysteine desulfurase family protein